MVERSGLVQDLGLGARIADLTRYDHSPFQHLRRTRVIAGRSPYGAQADEDGDLAYPVADVMGDFQRLFQYLSSTLVIPGRGPHASQDFKGVGLAQPVDLLMDPSETTAAEVAAAIAAGRLPGLGYWCARRRMERGAGLADIRETARLLLEGTDGPPGLEVLTWAAETAWLGGDQEEERRCFRAMLDRTAPDAAGASGSSREWTAVLRQAGEHGRPGEAIDLLEPYLRDHPDDDTAAHCHFSLLLDASEMREPDERDHAALERFADHTRIPAFRKAVGAYLAAHPDLGTLMESRAAADLSAIPGRLLPEPVLAECAALAFEATLHGADLAAAGLTATQATMRVKTKGTLRTAAAGTSPPRQTAPGPGSSAASS